MSRRITAIAAIGVAALILSGCSAVPNVQQIAEDAISNAIEGATGDSGTNVDIGTNAQLPADWPGLPVPEGQLISSMVIDGTFSVSYLVRDNAAVQAVKDALLEAGYEVVAESTGDINSLIMKNAEWTAVLGWYADGGDTMLTYGVTPTPAG